MIIKGEFSIFLRKKKHMLQVFVSVTSILMDTHIICFDDEIFTLATEFPYMNWDQLASYTNESQLIMWCCH